MSRLALSVIVSRILCLAAFFASFSALAQRQKQVVSQRVGSSIVDDTTRNVYGPATTKWTTERDLFENRTNYQPLDTSIQNYHRWTYVQRSNNFYKDLGPMGTALSSIFPQVPSSIGASPGFQVYEPYYTSEEPRYFDTKSPYTRMYIVWGGNGRATTKIDFSRNINPRWNFGFNYRPILVEKQLQRRQKGDYQTVSHYYDFYTTYKSKNEKYKLLFNYRRIRHRVLETGGVFNLLGQDSVKLYYDTEARPILVAAETEDYRRNIHLAQSYQLANALQIYTITDIYKQRNSFKDVPAQDPNTLFDNSEKLDSSWSDTATPSDAVNFESNQQEIGIKGNVLKLFYSGYYRFRNYYYSNPHYLNEIPSATGRFPSGQSIIGTESYLGGTMALQFDSLSSVRGSIEYLFPSYYRIEGQIQTPWIEGSFKSSLSKPGFMQQRYRGIHDSWNQSFVGINSTEAKGYLKWDKGPLKLWAGGTFTLFNNFVFFKEVSPVEPLVNSQRVLPYQSSGTQSTLSPEIKATLRIFKHLFIRPQYIITKLISNDDNALQIPTQFVNLQVTYENDLFKNHLQLQTGVDAHWHSAYDALGYDPAIQQFYSQTLSPSSQAFPLIDVFLTGKMRRARFFVKYHNVVQAVTGLGYLPTAGYLGQVGQAPGQYTGQRNAIDFGFDFLLFD
ncbi:putative porin [soil metagenome]